MCSLLLRKMSSVRITPSSPKKLPKINVINVNKEEDFSKGTAIVFPSFIWHRVTPVTKGIRYSVVAWFLGPPLR